MKIKTITLLAALALVAQGCTNVSHTITSKDGSQTSLKITGFMSNKSITKLSNGGATDKSGGKLSIGSAVDDVSNPMREMTAFLEALGALTAKSAVKTVAP
jgi:hypothetical protein